MMATPGRIGPRVLAALAVVVAATLATAAPANTSAAVPRPSKTVNLQLLSFNDYHGHLTPPTGTDATLGAQLDPAGNLVGGSEYLATHLQLLRSGHPNSLTVAAGDLIGGSPFLSGLFKDEPSVETLNTDGIDLDVSSVGNHEFDEGLTELLRMQNGGCHPTEGCFDADGYDGADFQWLAENVIHENTGDTVLPGTSVVEVDGVKVGFIGMTLEGTPEIVAASGIRGLKFLDEVDAANAAVPQLEAQGVRAIVVLLHEGGFQAGTYNQCTGISGPIVDIAENLDAQIDAVITGHTHQPYVCNIPDPSGAPRMVTSASSFGRVITETNLTINRSSGNVQRAKTTAVNHLVTRNVAPDAELTGIIAKWQSLAGPVANRPVGTITTDITRAINRQTESSLVNLIADAQLAATVPAPSSAQMAFMNPGGVRADLTYASSTANEGDGVVTYGEAFTVQPFGNFVTTKTMTGDMIERLLEQQFTDTGVRLLLGVSEGFTYTYDLRRPVGDRVDPGSIALNGVPIDPAASYQVTMNSFLADGGDGFTVFIEGTNPIGGGIDLDAFIAYLGANSPVEPAPTDRVTELP
jgi:5'-nucleotidase